MTFTKEQLITRAKMRLAMVAGFPESKLAQMDKHLAEIALSALTAEPVAYMIGGHYLMHAQDPKVDNYASAVPLYNAPPAPVSAPAGYRLQPISEYDAMCAAMLQSKAEPVSQPDELPEGWVAVPIEPTYQMCEAMGLPWESPRFPDRYKAMLAAAPRQEVK